MTINRCRFSCAVVLLAGLLLITGCASLGPVYQKVDQIPEGKGLAYIYRPAGFVGSGVSYEEFFYLFIDMYNGWDKIALMPMQSSGGPRRPGSERLHGRRDILHFKDAHRKEDGNALQKDAQDRR